MKRIISIFLVAVLMLCMFSGCCIMRFDRQDNYLEEPLNPSLEDYVPEDEITAPPEIEEPVSVPGLEYILDQEMIDLFYDLLEESEEKAIAGEDLEAAEAAAEQLDEAYMALVDQYQIAYVLYCMNQASEIGKQQYMDCVDLIAEVDTDYKAMCKRVYLSDSPLRDALFADWTQEEIDMLLAYNDEVAQLEKRNSEITVEYRELDSFMWEQNMVELYNEMVQNNNRIAEIYGYDNYYSYAYDQIYLRDYEMDSIHQMRQYASEYLAQIAILAVEKFNNAYEQLDFFQQMELSTLMNNSYSSLNSNFVQLFIDDMPQSSQEIMNNMFEKDRAVFTNSENAYEGAFTTIIGDEPFCFFGPGYDGTETVIHELGHYYGTTCTDFWSQPMDLSETQSQGNEWMYIHFLQKCVDPQMYEAIVEYRLISDASYILCFVMIDQFEEQVYTHPNAGNLTLEEYEAIMDEVAEDYGGIDMISQNILDIQSYWKYVVLESPVYYISYAVSGISAINLFTIAEEDEALAKEIYCRLMEEPLEGEGFLANITAAGLAGPFDKTVYEQLYHRYRN